MAIIRKGDTAAEMSLRKAADEQSRQKKYKTHAGTLRSAGRMNEEKLNKIKVAKESDEKVYAYHKDSGNEFTGPISGASTARVNPRIYKDRDTSYIKQLGSGVVKAGAVVKGGVGGIAQEMATKQRIKKRQQERNQNLSDNQFKGK